MGPLPRHALQSPGKDFNLQCVCFYILGWRHTLREHRSTCIVRFFFLDRGAVKIAFTLFAFKNPFITRFSCIQKSGWGGEFYVVGVQCCCAHDVSDSSSQKYNSNGTCTLLPWLKVCATPWFAFSSNTNNLSFAKRMPSLKVNIGVGCAVRSGAMDRPKTSQSAAQSGYRQYPMNAQRQWRERPSL